MAITRKKFETFDIDYSKVINGNEYYIYGQVVVRLADDKINSLDINIFDAPENDRNRQVVATLNYNEVSEDYGMSQPITCCLNVTATEELMQYFNNEIIGEIKSELFSEDD
ncbi:MAG: hypothetical protein HUJ96_06110 [Marinilabiliaceae bacterium]|nr:hypothetical protein [Marinilabiliaceae bacterium]